MPKAELPRFFYHIHEIERRPAFDPNCAITVKNFKSLIGRYKFSEDAICQILKPEGRCGHKHKAGWVGVTSDGKEGLIGGDCASKHFNADKSFATERRRVETELSIDDSINKLNTLLSDKNAFEKQLVQADEQLKQIKITVEEIKNKYPAKINKVLLDMDKRENRAVSIEVQYKNENNDGNDWVEQQIGSISGTNLWNYSNIGGVFTELKEIKRTLGDVVIKREVGDKILKKWVKTLSKLVSVIDKIGQLKNDIERFKRFDNLILLVQLVTNRREKSDLAKIAIELSEDETYEGEDPEKLVSKMESEIRRNNGNRNFRVPR